MFHKSGGYVRSMVGLLACPPNYPYNLANADKIFCCFIVDFCLLLKRCNENAYQISPVWTCPLFPHHHHHSICTGIAHISMLIHISKALTHFFLVWNAFPTYPYGELFTSKTWLRQHLHGDFPDLRYAPPHTYFWVYVANTVSASFINSGTTQKPPGDLVDDYGTHWWLCFSSICVDLSGFSDHRSMSSPHRIGKSVQELMPQKQPLSTEGQEFTDKHPCFLILRWNDSQGGFIPCLRGFLVDLSPHCLQPFHTF